RRLRAGDQAGRAGEVGLAHHRRRVRRLDPRSSGPDGVAQDHHRQRWVIRTHHPSPSCRRQEGLARARAALAERREAATVWAPTYRGASMPKHTPGVAPSTPAILSAMQAALVSGLSSSALAHLIRPADSIRAYTDSRMASAQR